MLTFPEKYFETEVRDGFAVNELMKRAWAASLEVLDRVIKICDKYDLTYYTYGGTLLGQVRHHGFIPWDDDLDIAMKRDDYIKFLEVAEEELPEEYSILNTYTDEEYNDFFTRITNGHIIDFSDKRLDQYHGCPFAVGIDIFPLYYIPGDADSAEAQQTILRMIQAVYELTGNRNEETPSVFEEETAEGLEGLEEITGYHFTADKPIRTQLQILYDQVSRLFGEQESDALAIFPIFMACGCMIEKELLAECIQMPFENLMLNAPKGYDKILKKLYGDYMVPKRGGALHEYPCFKEQLRDLGEYIEKQDCSWKMQQRKNADDLAAGLLMPKEWSDRIKGRKVILYHTSADALMCHGEFAADKLRCVLDTFRENPNVVLWWFPCLLDHPGMQFIKKMAPQLVQDYHQIIEQYKKEGWGILDDSGDMQRAVVAADAYYGDESGLLQLFRETGKYVMIQDYEIV